MSRTGRLVRIFLTALALIAGGLPTTAFAQYFGQNKVQYDTFEFRVLETEHFDIHYYPSEAEAANNKTVANVPILNQIVPHTDFVANCQAAVSSRRTWSIPLTVIGALAVLGSLAVPRTRTVS